MFLVAVSPNYNLMFTIVNLTMMGLSKFKALVFVYPVHSVLYIHARHSETLFLYQLFQFFPPPLTLGCCLDI